MSMVRSGVWISTALKPCSWIAAPAAVAAESTELPVRCGSGMTANLAKPLPYATTSGRPPGLATRLAPPSSGGSSRP